MLRCTEFSGPTARAIGAWHMNVQDEVISIVGRVLDLGRRGHALAPGTALLGSMPELDSMAVAAVITSLEEHFGFIIDDDEIDGAAFATVGTLVDFVKAKLAN